MTLDELKVGECLLVSDADPLPDEVPLVPHPSSSGTDADKPRSLSFEELARLASGLLGVVEWWTAPGRLKWGPPGGGAQTAERVAMGT